MRNEEEFDIGELLSRILSSDIFKGTIGVIIIGIIFFIPLAIEELYEKTLLLPLLFIHTIIRLVAENPIELLIFALIYAFINILATDDFKKIYFKTFRVCYFILCFIIITGQTLRMNTSYKLDNGPLTTAHILFYQVLDMIGNDTVTFYDEPCRMGYDTVTYYTIKRRGYSIVERTESYDYLCLDNQQDMIPIPSGYYREIEKLLEEAEGVCDITCYKYTHLIKAINGVELKDLGK